MTSKMILIPSDITNPVLYCCEKKTLLEHLINNSFKILVYCTAAFSSCSKISNMACRLSLCKGSHPKIKTSNIDLMYIY